MNLKLQLVFCVVLVWFGCTTAVHAEQDEREVVGAANEEAHSLESGSQEEESGSHEEEDGLLVPQDEESAPLDSGKEFCVSDCSGKYDFLATYKTGLDNSNQQLCDNEENVCEARGGPDCRADDWYIVESCQDCYEFGWRATYPTHCDCEDLWLWCCEPKIEMAPAVMCSEYQEKDIPCIVKDHHVSIDSLVITWTDMEGNNLAGVEGYDVSSTYKISEDQLLSVLSVSSSAIPVGTLLVMCHATRENDEEATWNSATTVTKYSINAAETTVPVGQEAFITCSGSGVYDKANFGVTWYYYDEGGEKLPVNPEVTSVSTVVDDDGDWQSILTASKAAIELDHYKIQCVASCGSPLDKCGLDHSTSCSAFTDLYIWDATPDTYCAYTHEVATLTTTIEGLPGVPLSAVQIESLTSGNVIDSTTDPVTGYSISGEYNDAGLLEVTLTVTTTPVPHTEEFVTKVYGSTPNPDEEPEANLILHVMEVTSGAVSGTDSVPGEEDVVVSVELEGGNMESLVWTDNKGRYYSPGTEDGVTVTLAETEDGSETTLTIVAEEVPELGITEVCATFRIRNPSGSYCRRDKFCIPITPSECVVEWDKPECDYQPTCTDYSQDRTWSCKCKDGNNDISRCTEPDEIVTFDCPSTLPYSLGEWTNETCDHESCYPYAHEKTRSCKCSANGQDYFDETGGKCNQPILTQLYFCGATKPWVPGEWDNGDCPALSCFPSETIDRRDCVCDEFSDRSKCEDDLLSRVRHCEPTKEFEWSPWGEEVCDIGDRCRASDEIKTRDCVCENYGVEYRDHEKCEGESETEYTCPGNLEWIKTPTGNPCDDTETESCSAFTAQQHFQCVCKNGNNYDLDSDIELCDGAPEDVTCPANEDYGWSPWTSISECSHCYPELDQTQVRYCHCGDKEDDTRCEGPNQRSEPCPQTNETRWFPTEWSEYACGDLFCNKETYTIKDRECQCEGNKDKSRCGDEPMTETVSCGKKEYELSEWSNLSCNELLCHPYNTTITRTCTCTDTDGIYNDEEFCDADPLGYTQEDTCEGYIYEWGDWASRGCPTDTCVPSKRKRYRICACLGHVNFDNCGEEPAIDFVECELPESCNEP